ncbi:MAG: GMC family oxidoreductase [Woeseia sp.]|nr:GMC family oxidoreductase [Woeseia sp.]
MASKLSNDFDAIVVGSGISGGWAAKELSEKGLKVLLLERGRNVQHRKDYSTEGKAAWEMPYAGQIPEALVDSDYPIQNQCYAFSDYTKHFFVNDREHPYCSPEKKPFSWIRGYHLGGRSLLWHRHSYRLSDLDFEANKLDSHGIDWPIRYKDLAPWYDHVEAFAGISGSYEGLPQLPDGILQPPFEMNCVEKDIKKNIEKAFPDRKLIMGRVAHLTKPTQEQIELGRSRCMNRDECQRGCSFGAYFSSLSATLPAAERTGNLTILTDVIVESVIYDHENNRASGVRVVNANDRSNHFFGAKIVFLCASTLATTQIMLNSKSEFFPNGIANSSGTLGHYLMDHLGGAGASGVFPGHQDVYDVGRRGGGLYLPRFRNVTDKDQRFLRGYGYQGGAQRLSWSQGNNIAGIGVDFKAKLRKPGPWVFDITGFGEMLPDERNCVRLSNQKKDKWGIPVLEVDCDHRENELAMFDAIMSDAKDLLTEAGLIDIKLKSAKAAPGLMIHEMGTARMGYNPKASVLNKYNQAHEVPNLFVTDGSAMTSSACQNPSLTYMALTARAANSAVEMLREGKI